VADDVLDAFLAQDAVRVSAKATAGRSGRTTGVIMVVSRAQLAFVV
jgi:hypothetical protein